MFNFFRKKNKEEESSTTKKALKIAHIDTNYIISQSVEFQKLKQEQMTNERETKMWITNANEEVMKQPTVEEQHQLADKYNFELSQKQQIFQLNHDKRLQDIDYKITKIIEEEAKKMNYDFVLSKGLVIFGADDITLQIAELVRKM